MDNKELKTARINLYIEYIDELRVYDPVIKNMTANDVIQTVSSYMVEDKLNLGEWIDIKKDGKIVGFVIISRSEDECHPDANYEICQTFIEREYRRQGLSKRTVIEYLKKHPGVVALDILIGNYNANLFWNDVMKEVGARYIDLSEIREGDITNYVQLYGYKVS